MNQNAASSHAIAEFRRLTRIGRALNHVRTSKEVLELAVHYATELLGASKALLMMMDDNGQVSIKAAVGVDGAAVDRFREPMNGALVERLKSLLGCMPDRFLGVPLMVNAQVAGVIAVTMPEPVRARVEMEALLTALADQVTIALERSRLTEGAAFREQLLGIVGDDLKNLLDSIFKSMSKLLSAHERHPNHLETLLAVRRSADRAQRMVADLLDFTADQFGGRMQLNVGVCDLHTLVEQSTDALDADSSTRIRMSCKGPGTGLWDRDRLMQLVGNLLSNALHRSAPSTPVVLSTEGHADLVMIRVNNVGRAIPRHILPTLFDAMKRTAEGAISVGTIGVGLQTVRHIAEAHGGTVSVESNDHDGTTLTVILPRGLIVASDGRNQN